MIQPKQVQKKGIRIRLSSWVLAHLVTRMHSMKAHLVCKRHGPVPWSWWIVFFETNYRHMLHLLGCWIVLDIFQLQALAPGRTHHAGFFSGGWPPKWVDRFPPVFQPDASVWRRHRIIRSPNFKSSTIKCPGTRSDFDGRDAILHAKTW